jgi:hypothetical protein
VVEGQLRLAAHPQRAVPVDLSGRCFNYFSTSHFAVFCWQRTRCFKCRALGHRSSKCPSLRGGIVENQSFDFLHRTLNRVWKPKIQGMVLKNGLTRCFKCCSPSHRSFECLSLSGDIVRKRSFNSPHRTHTKVWKPKVQRIMWKKVLPAMFPVTVDTS